MLRTRLISQSLTIILITLALTLFSGFLYVKLVLVFGIEPDDGMMLIVVMSSVFTVSFTVSSIIIMRWNTDNIILPLKTLRNQTESIRRGNLDAIVSVNGLAGELRALADEIEMLRIELKDSVYYRNKVDEDRKFLVSSISHDLKTPVTSIRGYIDGVLDNVADTDEKKRDYLNKAVAKTMHINSMIDDLLLFSRLNLNQMSFDMRRVHVNDIFHQLECEYSSDFGNEGMVIKLENEIKRDIYIRIDIDKLNRATQNIIENAIKYNNAEEGILRIIVRETNASVLIEFKDNGMGIDERELPHIFERFYRGNEARTADGSGGLGLAITKQIIEGMGGRIWAISKIGKGTSFIISLRKV